MMTAKNSIVGKCQCIDRYKENNTIKCRCQSYDYTSALCGFIAGPVRLPCDVEQSIDENVDRLRTLARQKAKKAVSKIVSFMEHRKTEIAIKKKTRGVERNEYQEKPYHLYLTQTQLRVMLGFSFGGFEVNGIRLEYLLEIIAVTLMENHRIGMFNIYSGYMFVNADVLFSKCDKSRRKTGKSERRFVSGFEHTDSS